MSGTTYQMCAHLAGNTLQALAVIQRENGPEEFCCAPCLAERIQELLIAVSPSAIPYLVKFNRCNHHANDAMCGLCYAGVIGCLMLQFSYLKLQAESHAANRLGNAIRELIRHLGKPSFV